MQDAISLQHLCICPQISLSDFMYIYLFKMVSIVDPLDWKWYMNQDNIDLYHMIPYISAMR